jgi:hypothetical protein
MPKKKIYLMTPYTVSLLEVAEIHKANVNDKGQKHDKED